MRRQAIGTGDSFVLDPQVMCDCGNHACSFMEVHAVDFCTPEDRTISTFLCKPCLDTNIERAKNIILEGPTFCGTCFTNLVTLSDLIVRLVPMAGLGKPKTS